MWGREENESWQLSTSVLKGAARMGRAPHGSLTWREGLGRQGKHNVDRKDGLRYTTAHGVTCHRRHLQLLAKHGPWPSVRSHSVIPHLYQHLPDAFSTIDVAVTFVFTLAALAPCVVRCDAATTPSKHCEHTMLVLNSFFITTRTCRAKCWTIPVTALHRERKNDESMMP
jgi:hypothetical protein